MPLVTNNFILDIVPGKAPPIVHVSESDVGRTYSVTILNEGSELMFPNGTGAKVEGSIGSHSFSENAIVSGSTVTFSLTRAMTVLSGKVWCKIKFTSGSESISSCGFWLAVDKGAYNIPSF